MSARFGKNRGISTHHDSSPSNAKSRQENPRPYLECDNRRGRLKDCVRDEENQSRNRVSIALVGLQIVVHAGDCGVRPDRLLDEDLSGLWLEETYMLPLSMRETQYIRLEEYQSA